MANKNSWQTAALSVETLEARMMPSSSPTSPVAVLLRESFDKTRVGEVPPAWSWWSDGGSVGVANQRSSLSLVASAGSKESARAWVNASQPADVRVSANLFLDSLVPGQVLARGRNLNTATPTYYAASVTRGLELQLVRLSNGRATTLGRVQSDNYVSNQWVRVTLDTSGTDLAALVYRLDTGMYLNGSGEWQATPVWALTVKDSAVTGSGQVGLARPTSYAGTVSFDDFMLAQVDLQPPRVNITAPAAGVTLRSQTTVQATVTDNLGVDRVEFYVDNVRQATDTTVPYTWLLDPNGLTSGSHNLTVLAYDRAGNPGQATLTVSTQKTTAQFNPSIPRHYSHIRIAQLAYSGSALGSLETQLLKNSVDLVVANTAYLADISAIAPNTPQLIYTNTSSLYRELLTDWLTYADARAVNREAAFYHVARALPFSGQSYSSQPVNWFWSVYRGGQTANFIDLTSLSRTATRSLAFGDLGESVYLGYPDRFREINIDLASGASRGWTAVLEYPTVIDNFGNPIAWATLSTVRNSTQGLTRSGQITFDPPANWKAAKLNGSARLFYVRLRTTVAGTAPVANTLLGRDYVSAGGTTNGTIPAFDAAADANRDGYLNDTEYTRRASGKNARFLYESRLFQASYGQMRPATNPSSQYFRNWAADYHLRFLNSQPLADGLFVDNSTGRLPVKDSDLLESVSSYANDYGTLIDVLARAVAPRWLLPNTSSGGTDADPVVRATTAYYEEFAIRALAHHYQQFEDLAATIGHRQDLRTPAPYAVLDSLPTGGSPTDARTQLATLAYYYLLADPDRTFLNFFGGYEPATSWDRHWTPAAAYNVGRPSGSWSLFATGADPANRALTYRIYQRSYTNALVLYKPLAYAQGATSVASLANGTSTTHRLGGTYRPLRADGTLGSPVTSISLRNGEGAILIKA